MDDVFDDKDRIWIAMFLVFYTIGLLDDEKTDRLVENLKKDDKSYEESEQALKERNDGD